MPKYDLVISRHNEDISWIREVPREFRVLIYDASDKDHQLDNKKVAGMVLSNRSLVLPIKDGGGEAGGYLHHMHHEHEFLADFTVFSQGRPDDHMAPGRKIGEKLQEYINAKTEDFYPIGDKTAMIWDIYLHPRVLKMPSNPKYKYTQDAQMRDFREWFLKDREPVPEKWEVAYGSIFGIGKSRILRNMKIEYKTLYDWASHAPMALETGILEWVWPLLFLRRNRLRG